MKRKNISISLTEEMIQELKNIAEKQNRTLSNLIEVYLLNEIETHYRNKILNSKED